MKEIKHFTMSVMIACIIFSLYLTRGIPYFTDELIVLIIICISLILPVLACIINIRGENNELRLRRMIRIIKISMVYQILIVPVALLVTAIVVKGAFDELSTIRILSFFALFAAIGSAYLLIGTQMQYKNLLELNKKSKQ
jgi:hypothetical protein